MFEISVAVIDHAVLAGRVAGIIFWAAVLGAGIAKCIAISRRPTTSTLCVTSLTMALAAFLASSILGMIQGALPAPLNLILIALICLFVLVATIAGLTLGIVGLATYRHGFRREGQTGAYTQGTTQAGWGIALNVLFVAIFLISFVVGIVGRSHRAAPMNPVAGGQKKEVYTVEDMNFRLRVPGTQWMQMDAGTIMESSSLVLRQRFPEIYVSVIAEQLGVEYGLTSDKLAEVSQANLKSGCPGASLGEQEMEAHNGLLGTRFTADAEIGRLELSYEYWCYAGSGYGYQIIIWARRTNKELLHTVASQVFAGFEQLDPEHRYYAAGNGAFGVYESEPFAYFVDLSGTDWCSWDNLSETDPAADTGGHHPGGMRFSITPLLLPEGGVPVDYIRQGLLNLYGISGEMIGDSLKPVQVADLDGCTYSLSARDNRYYEMLLASSNCAYLVSAWLPESKLEGAEPLAAQLFDAISFSPSGIASNAVGMLSEPARLGQANMINQIGLAYYNDGRFPESQGLFRQAAEWNRQEPSYFGNVLAAYRQMAQCREGIEFFESAGEDARKSDAAIRSWEASLLQGAGRLEDADAAYQALFEAGYRDDEDFRQWTDIRTENGNWDDLDDLFTRYAGNPPSVDLRIHQMELYWKKGDFQKVIDLARASESNYGFSSDVAYWEIEACQERGLFKEALEVCDQLIQKGFVSVETYQKKATSEYRLKWHRQAKESLEAALRLNPHNKTTKEWLQQVSAELGESDNSSLKDVVDPVPAPAGLDELLGAEAPEEFGSEFGAYYERQLTLWDYRKEERLCRTDRHRIKLLDESGVSAFSSLEYSFSPLSEKVFVNRLEVRNELGEVVSRGMVKDYYLRDDASDGLVSEDKTLVMPVPGLVPGYTIELEITREYTAPPEEFYFDRSYMASGFPVLQSAIYLAGEPDSVASICLNGVERRTLDHGGLLWLETEPVTYRWEPLQLPVERFVPCVVLGPTNTSWEACGQEYLDKISERLGSSDALKARVKDLTADGETDEDRYKAIIDWIRASFSYKPLEFGRSAYMPDRAEDTLSCRYGDCKDLSVLLMEMLAAAGLESRLVLVNSSSDVYPEIATTDQFDHVIVYVPGIRGGIFVDPTDQEAEAFLAVPSSLAKKRALVLDPASLRLETIPAYLADSSRCSIQRTLNPGSELVELRDRIILRGYYASWMRSVLKDQKKVDWVKWFQKNIADFVPDLEVKSITALQVNSPDQDLQLEIAYVLRNAIQQRGEQLSMKIPAIWVDRYLSAQKVQERRNPFWLSYPLSLELVTRINLPEGYELGAPAWEETSERGRFIEWESRSDDPLGGHYTCRVKPGEFEAGDYADYVSATDEAIRAATLQVEFVKAAPKTVAALTDDDAR